MAGRRLTRQAGEPQATASARRRHAALVQRMADAQTPDEQIAVASAYLRSRFGIVPAELKTNAAGPIVDRILALADALPIRTAQTATGGNRT